MALEGFILTRQWIESAAGFEIIFWLSTPQGPLRYQVHQQEAVLFVDQQQMTKLNSLLARRQGWRANNLPLKNFQQQPVAALYFRSQRNLYECRELFRQHNIDCYEADIKPPDRFLMERFITGAVSISSPVDRDEQGRLLSCRVAKGNEIKTSDYRPALKAISIDIETDFSGRELFSIGAYAEGVEKVFMVGGTAEGSLPISADVKNNLLKNEVAVEFFESEASVLVAFLTFIADYDPDILMGWNVVNFDLRCLQLMCDRLNLSFTLGRDAGKVIWRQSRDNADRHYALIPGRVALDGIELMRSATYSFESFSLEHVAQKVLQRGKLVDDVEQRSDHIRWQFENDKFGLAKYNLEDCRLVWDIFEQEKLIDFSLERSRLTGLELDRYGGSVAAFDFLYLPRLHREGYVAPGMEQQRVSNVSPGGYVMNSIPGIYDNVIVLDFKSLYPSIIRTFRVDPLALVRGLEEDDAIPGFDDGKFSRRSSILPGVIENLWAARDRAKANKNSVLSQAIKIIMNSFYGVLGTSGCRFLDSRLVSSITKRGHQIIIDSKAFIEQEGYKVIYGDTDSVFVLTGTDNKQDALKKGKALEQAMNRWWSSRLEKEFNLESCLEIEFETLFSKFLMPTVRGAETGSKKRYAGLIEGRDGEPELLFKGLESVRSDWSPLARQFQQELYRRIFLNLPYEQYIKDLVGDIVAGKYEQELVLRKRLRRKLSDYVKNVPPHVQAARLAQQFRREQLERDGLDANAANSQGGNSDIRGSIDYFITVNGPEPKEYRKSPIDYEFYIEKQITPIADSILIFRASSMDKLLNRQIGLF